MRGPIAFTFYLTLLTGLFFGSSSLYAQLDARVMLHDKMEEIGMYKSFIKSFELKQGEEVLMNIEVVGGKKIHSFIIEQPGTPLKMVARKVRRIERGSFLVNRDGDYTFIWKNRGLGKKNVRIRIEKYPKKSTRDTMILDDIIVTTTIDTLRSAYADTTNLPDVSQISFELQPSLDFKTSSDSCVTEMLIDGEKYQFAVYWIGIGAAAKKEYDKLKSSPPPSWTLAGVNDPLFAYGMGLTQKLPMSSSSLAKNIRFAFQDPNAPNEELTLGDSNPALYGVIPVYKAGKFQKVKLCFRNFNTTTRVPIYVYFAKYKLEKKENLEIIKRERVQEIFIKRAVEYYEVTEE